MTHITDELIELRRKLRPPCPAIDVHVHPLSSFGRNSGIAVADDVERMTTAARRAGVRKICVFHLAKGTPREPTLAQLIEGNDYNREMRDMAPDWFLPFVYVNPVYPQESVDEIHRRATDEQFCGVKLWVSRRATDKGLDPIMEAAVKFGLPVLQHAWYKTTGNLEGESTPADVADLARRHPKANIIMAHLNGHGFKGIEDVADTPNVVVDFAGGDPETAIVERAISVLGPNRLVYGSDAPIRHFGVSVAKVIDIGLSVGVQKKLLWENAARILPPWSGISPVAPTLDEYDAQQQTQQDGAGR